MNKKFRVFTGLVIVGLALTACSSPTKGDAPEPTPDGIINGTNTQVIRMPEGFRNLAFTCHGNVGIYVTSRGWIKNQSSADFTALPSAVTAVPDHPACP